MTKNPRCLFNSDFVSFLNSDNNAILGELCNNYHGSALTKQSKRGNLKLK